MDSQRWNQIERVYEAARKLPPADRETFLAKACENDADLAGEVAHLLESTDALLFSVEDSGVATATYVEDSVLPPDLKLGPYQIIGPLGEDGMGKVYRARDTRLDRPVAIKVSSQRFSRRFEQEARSISALNHPNICTLYDVGSLPSGAGFLVTELVEGETLRDWLKRSGPGSNPDRKVAIARQVLEALRAAHSAGFVHRDLKPANIMVRYDSYVKVLDFGLAKRVNRLPKGDKPSLSASTPGQMIGT
ncbi:MAG: serine/threonine protein kinase, partial [Acidobacteriia bacterium]|nr:serine/threonine protein kinase [Terriglobia bacterium]